MLLGTFSSYPLFCSSSRCQTSFSIFSAHNSTFSLSGCSDPPAKLEQISLKLTLPALEDYYLAIRIINTKKCESNKIVLIPSCLTVVHFSSYLTMYSVSHFCSNTVSHSSAPWLT
jgi:hypothetical protein